MPHAQLPSCIAKSRPVDRNMARQLLAVEQEADIVQDASVSFTGIHQPDNNDVKYEVERKVNIFAAKLLMPANLLLNDLRVSQDPQFLARRFDVSRSAMQRRLLELQRDLQDEFPTQSNSYATVDLSDPGWEVCQLPPDDDSPS